MQLSDFGHKCRHSTCIMFLAHRMGTVHPMPNASLVLMIRCRHSTTDPDQRWSVEQRNYPLDTKKPALRRSQWCQSSAALRRSKALPKRARNLEIRFLSLNWPGRLCLGDQVEGHSPEKNAPVNSSKRKGCSCYLSDWSQLEISLESLSRCWRPRPSKAKLLFSCTFLLMPIWWRLLKIIVLSKLLLNYTQGGSPCESQVPNSLVPHVQILNYCYFYHRSSIVII